MSGLGRTVQGRVQGRRKEASGETEGELGASGQSRGGGSFSRFSRMAFGDKFWVLEGPSWLRARFELG